MVIAGKDKGKSGKVIRVLLEAERVLVEGINVVKRHMKPNSTNPQGGIMEKNLSIHVSNVLPLDPKTNQASRVGKKWEEGKKGGQGQWVRVLKKSGTVLQ